MRWGRGRKILLGTLLWGILVFLVLAMGNTYEAYQQMIVKQQQSHLLLATHAVSQNLELYLSEQLRQVRMLTQTPGFLDAMEAYYQTGEAGKVKEYIFSYMLSDQQGPSRMYLVNRSGEKIFHYNQYPFLEEFDDSVLNLEECVEGSQSGIGRVFQIGENHYGMTLLNRVYGGGGYLGTVVSVLDLTELYNRFVASLSLGGAGYISVQDDQGTVIMHREDRMLGLNYRQDIPLFQELPQYASMRRMLERQYGQEEGTAEYEGFYNGIMPPEKEICAFSRMNLWGTSWYISAVMPYSQAVAMEVGNLKKFSMLFGAILLIVITAAGIIYVLMRNRQKLELEAGYLREINRTLEELNQSRGEVRHYQKLTTIGTLAGGIAHEFNNLLTPILGYSEFLRERMGRDSEYYEDLEEIHKAGIRAKEIVEQILPFSRKETDDTASYRTMNLDVVIRDAAKMVRLLMPANIRIELELEDENANIYGNATQIHQILLNLYSNAIQSMEPGGGVLTVGTRRIHREQLPQTGPEMPGAAAAQVLELLPGAQYVEILVEDTGCGMEREVLQQIFNPFFTTKGTEEGTGLGLSVVKDILVTHGGLIHVESQPGKGSCFYIHLPVAGKGIPTQTVVEETKKKAGGHKRPLLLVDDEEPVVRYLSRRLERKGYQVDGYSDPAEALKAVEQNPGKWDAAIVDYMMPSYKGTVLARQMRVLGPDMGIILITGFLESEAVQMWKEGGLDRIVVKPVDFEELLEAVEAAAGNSCCSRGE